MPKLFTDGNPRMVAYYLDGGGSGYQNLPAEVSSMEAEYIAVVYGLNEYFLKWNKELDSRQYNGDEKVATPSQETKRPLPPPVMICCDNQVVVNQLSRHYHISNSRLRVLAQRVWQMAENVDVIYCWVPRNENLAGKMLR